MWGYFWLIVGSMLAGSLMFGAGVTTGMIMMSVALAEDEDQDDDIPPRYV